MGLCVSVFLTFHESMVQVMSHASNYDVCNLLVIIITIRRREGLKIDDVQNVNDVQESQISS